MNRPQPKLTPADKRDATLQTKAEAKTGMIKAKYQEYINSQMGHMNTMLTNLGVDVQNLKEQIVQLPPDDMDIVILTAELTAKEQILEDAQYIRDGFLLAIRIALIRLEYSLQYCLIFKWYDAIASFNTKHLDKMLGRRNADYAAVLSDILNISDAIATRMDKIGAANAAFGMYRNNIKKTTETVLSQQSEESRKKYEEVMKEAQKKRTAVVEEQRQKVNQNAQ